MQSAKLCFEPIKSRRHGDSNQWLKCSFRISSFMLAETVIGVFICSFLYLDAVPHLHFMYPWLHIKRLRSCNCSISFSSEAWKIVHIVMLKHFPQYHLRSFQHVHQCDPHNGTWPWTCHPEHVCTHLYRNTGRSQSVCVYLYSSDKCRHF